MSMLNREQDELEHFLDDYTNQIRMMSALSDTEIKLVMRRVMDESPEWFEAMLSRYRKKALTKLMKNTIKDVQNDFSKEVRKVA